MITYAKVTMDERNALHKDACAWARRNLQRLPIDRRPLKRRLAGPQTADGAVDDLLVTP